jgi:hypothetical protein
MALANKGICKMTTFDSSKTSGINMDGLDILRTKVEDYCKVLALVKNAFNENKVPFPTQSLQQFTESVDDEDEIYNSILVGEDGYLDQLSAYNMLLQSSYNKNKINPFAIKLEAKIQFLLQMALDTLPFEVTKTIKNKYAGTEK